MGKTSWFLFSLSVTIKHKKNQTNHLRFSDGEVDIITSTKRQTTDLLDRRTESQASDWTAVALLDELERLIRHTATYIGRGEAAETHEIEGEKAVDFVVFDGEHRNQA